MMGYHQALAGMMCQTHGSALIVVQAKKILRWLRYSENYLGGQPALITPVAQRPSGHNLNHRALGPVGSTVN